LGVSGQVTDNAIGQLSSLVYCPQGMGTNGTNILNAMKNGRLILSSGPIVGFEIDTDNTNNIPEILLGSDTIIDFIDCANININVFAANSVEYGDIIRKQIIIMTETDKTYSNLPEDTATYQLNLLNFLNSNFTSPEDYLDKWFLIRAEIETNRTSINEDIYKCTEKSS